jgi:hypothetical protein
MMSISELFSKVRDALMRSDFELVEKPIIAREEILKEFKRLKRWREN